MACQEPGCSYKTSSLSALQNHRLIHARKNERLSGKRTCPACHTISSTPKANRDHALEAHSETIDLINDTIVQCIVDEKCTWKS